MCSVLHAPTHGWFKIIVQINLVETFKYHTPGPALSNPAQPNAAVPRPFHSVSSVRRTKACKRQTSQGRYIVPKANKAKWDLQTVLICMFSWDLGRLRKLLFILSTRRFTLQSVQVLVIVNCSFSWLEQDNGCSSRGASLKSHDSQQVFLHVFH